MGKDNENLDLANFIVSFGSMNNYSSSVLQTKKALDLNDLSKLEQNTDDGDIFKDALDGITAAKKYGFSTQGIIEINRQFTHSQEEDPKLPGHLRTSKYYNPDDAVVIITDPHGTTKDAYYAPDDVYVEDLDQIIDEFGKSEKNIKDAWRVFARISKLQPFQDGNKRTALIAANAALGTFESKDYLTLPFDNIDHAEFMINLMRFYKAEDVYQEELALDKMVNVLPSKKEVQYHLKNELVNKKQQLSDLKTRKVKSFYSKSKLDLE